ncbi:hypothetical protein BH20VER2_BH20VER2_17930 [soil metagenome]
MKGNGDVARSWLAKADADMVVAKACLQDDRAFNAACFHSQQAAEKTLKAWLIAGETEFPFIHDLRKLLNRCARRNPEFGELEAEAFLLNPYAVELRYSTDFWATRAEAMAAIAAASKVRDFIMKRWPAA